ncbi:MAG TPA: DNA polymerase III subunit delta' [Virgibacillus sp.]|nr:DNA polymerase III subunit delta' [Virgibacillus sp.]
MKTWSEIGETQPLASRIITNSMMKDRMSHAYLIQGDRGTGKQAIALLLAKSLFCENRTVVEPCQICNVCKRIESGNHPDVHWIKPDGQSIKIEQIRKLQEEFSYSGLESNQKVYIIVGSDTLTLNAANRILKFLEEPSKKTTAIMLTENSQSIISTIQSRCQIIDLKPLNPQRYQEQLLGLGMSKANAMLMSALTHDIDDAFEISEDEWFAQARKLVLQLIEVYSIRPTMVFLFIHQHWLPHFKDLNQHEQGLDLLLLAFKDILYYHVGSKGSMVFFVNQDEKLEKAASFFPETRLLRILHDILEAKRKLRQYVHPTLVMEQLALHI